MERKERRHHTREFKLEAVRLVRERGVSIAQASRDLDLHENMLRKWLKDFAADPAQAFPWLLATGHRCSGSHWGANCAEGERLQESRKPTLRRRLVFPFRPFADLKTALAIGGDGRANPAPALNTSHRAVGRTPSADSCCKYRDPNFRASLRPPRVCFRV